VCISVLCKLDSHSNVARLTYSVSAFRVLLVAKHKPAKAAILLLLLFSFNLLGCNTKQETGRSANPFVKYTIQIDHRSHQLKYLIVYIWLTKREVK